MLAVNIKICITNFSTCILFKIHSLNKKKVVLVLIKKVEISEIAGLKIFRSNTQVNLIFITYTL